MSADPPSKNHSNSNKPGGAAKGCEYLLHPLCASASWSPDEPALGFSRRQGYSNMAGSFTASTEPNAMQMLGAFPAGCRQQHASSESAS